MKAVENFDFSENMPPKSRRVHQLEPNRQGDHPHGKEGKRKNQNDRRKNKQELKKFY